MQARFRDWENKALVQVAAQFELEGLRITWPDFRGVFIRGGNDVDGANESEHGIDVVGKTRHAEASGPGEISYVLNKSLEIVGTDDQD
ncbi:hypothetical protein GN244_ATG14644 [Phytophthora infestans]|uniref:Uncharacterized protein n=1 Tax=Phytophthora infestans TaxID=4787 RepID=A0A833SUA0_PHYIN|nr:hypothetical protein GN244_ATG14644 [Phytophthora infestans]